MNTATILDLIAQREAAATQAANRLRDQIAHLTTELARIDSELADLATTRATLRTITADECTSDDPVITSLPYQQILAVLNSAATPMRAKDICIALGVEPRRKHIEGIRAKLKRLVAHKILSHPEPGIFALTPKPA